MSTIENRLTSVDHNRDRTGGGEAMVVCCCQSEPVGAGPGVPHLEHIHAGWSQGKSHWATAASVTLAWVNSEGKTPK